MSAENHSNSAPTDPTPRTTCMRFVSLSPQDDSGTSFIVVGVYM
jgi:hypothetical protein